MPFYVHISAEAKAEEAAVDEAGYVVGPWSSKPYNPFLKYVHPCECNDQCCIGTNLQLDFTRYKRGTVNNLQGLVQMIQYPEYHYSEFHNYWWLDCFYPALLKVCISLSLSLSLSVCLCLRPDCLYSALLGYVTLCLWTRLCISISLPSSRYDLNNVERNVNTNMYSHTLVMYLPVIPMVNRRPPLHHPPHPFSPHRNQNVLDGQTDAVCGGYKN